MAFSKVQILEHHKITLSEDRGMCGKFTAQMTWGKCAKTNARVLVSVTMAAALSSVMPYMP
jgi:hypothetical protein